MTLTEILTTIKEIALPVAAIIGAVISSIYSAADRKTLFAVKDQQIQNLESENKRLKEWSPDVVEEWALSYKRQHEIIIKDLNGKISDFNNKITQKDEKIKLLKSQKATTEKEKAERDVQIALLSNEKNELSQKIQQLSETGKVVDKNYIAISTVSDSLGTIVTSGAQVELRSQGVADIWLPKMNSMSHQLYIQHDNSIVDPMTGRLAVKNDDGTLIDPEVWEPFNNSR